MQLGSCFADYYVMPFCQLTFMIMNFDFCDSLPRDQKTKERKGFLFVMHLNLVVVFGVLISWLLEAFWTNKITNKLQWKHFKKELKCSLHELP